MKYKFTCAAKKFFTFILSACLVGTSLLGTGLPGYSYNSDFLSPPGTDGIPLVELAGTLQGKTGTFDVSDPERIDVNALKEAIAALLTPKGKPAFTKIQAEKAAHNICAGRFQLKSLPHRQQTALTTIIDAAAIPKINSNGNGDAKKKPPSSSAASRPLRPAASPPRLREADLKNLFCRYIADKVGDGDKDNNVVYLDPSQIEGFIGTDGMLKGSAQRILSHAGYISLVNDVERLPGGKDEYIGLLIWLLQEDYVESIKEIPENDGTPARLLVSFKQDYIRIPDTSGRIIRQIHLIPNNSDHTKPAPALTRYEDLSQLHELVEQVKTGLFQGEGADAQCWILHDKNRLLENLQSAKNIGDKKTVMAAVAQRIIAVQLLSRQDLGIKGEHITAILPNKDASVLMKQTHAAAQGRMEGNRIFTDSSDTRMLWCAVNTDPTSHSPVATPINKPFCRTINITASQGVYYVSLVQGLKALKDRFTDMDILRSDYLSAENFLTDSESLRTAVEDTRQHLIEKYNLRRKTLDELIRLSKESSRAKARIISLCTIMEGMVLPPLSKEITRQRVAHLKENLRALNEVYAQVLEPDEYMPDPDTVQSIKDIENAIHDPHKTVEYKDIALVTKKLRSIIEKPVQKFKHTCVSSFFDNNGFHTKIIPDQSLCFKLLIAESDKDLAELERTFNLSRIGEPTKPNLTQTRTDIIEAINNKIDQLWVDSGSYCLVNRFLGDASGREQDDPWHKRAAFLHAQLFPPDDLTAMQELIDKTKHDLQKQGISPDAVTERFTQVTRMLFNQILLDQFAENTYISLGLRAKTLTDDDYKEFTGMISLIRCLVAQLEDMDDLKARLTAFCGKLSDPKSFGAALDQIHPDVIQALQILNNKLEENSFIEYPDSSQKRIFDFELKHALEVTAVMKHSADISALIRQGIIDIKRDAPDGEPSENTIQNLCQLAGMMSEWLLRARNELDVTASAAASLYRILNPHDSLVEWELEKDGTRIKLLELIHQDLGVNIPPVLLGGPLITVDSETTDKTTLHCKILLPHTLENLFQCVDMLKSDEERVIITIRNAWGSPLALNKDDFTAKTQLILTAQHEPGVSEELVQASLRKRHERVTAENCASINDLVITKLADIAGKGPISEAIPAAAKRAAADHQEPGTEILKSICLQYQEAVTTIMHTEGVQPDDIAAVCRGMGEDLIYLTSLVERILPDAADHTRTKCIKDLFDVAMLYRVYAAIYKKYMLDSRIFEKETNITIADEAGKPIFTDGKFALTPRAQERLASYLDKPAPAADSSADSSGEAFPAAPAPEVTPVAPQVEQINLLDPQTTVEILCQAMLRLKDQAGQPLFKEWSKAIGLAKALYKSRKQPEQFRRICENKKFKISNNQETIEAVLGLIMTAQDEHAAGPGGDSAVKKKSPKKKEQLSQLLGSFIRQTQKQGNDDEVIWLNPGNKTLGGFVDKNGLLTKDARGLLEDAGYTALIDDKDTNDSFSLLPWLIDPRHIKYIEAIDAVNGSPARLEITLQEQFAVRIPGHTGRSIQRFYLIDDENKSPLAQGDISRFEDLTNLAELRTAVASPHIRAEAADEKCWILQDKQKLYDFILSLSISAKDALLAYVDKRLFTVPYLSAHDAGRRSPSRIVRIPTNDADLTGRRIQARARRSLSDLNDGSCYAHKTGNTVLFCQAESDEEESIPVKASLNGLFSLNDPFCRFLRLPDQRGVCHIDIHSVKTDLEDRLKPLDRARGIFLAVAQEQYLKKYFTDKQGIEQAQDRLIKRGYTKAGIELMIALSWKMNIAFVQADSLWRSIEVREHDEFDREMILSRFKELQEVLEELQRVFNEAPGNGEFSYNRTATTAIDAFIEKKSPNGSSITQQDITQLKSCIVVGTRKNSLLFSTLCDKQIFDQKKITTKLKMQNNGQPFLIAKRDDSKGDIDRFNQIQRGIEMCCYYSRIGNIDGLPGSDELWRDSILGTLKGFYPDEKIIQMQELITKRKKQAEEIGAADSPDAIDQIFAHAQQTLTNINILALCAHECGVEIADHDVDDKCLISQGNAQKLQSMLGITRGIANELKPVLTFLKQAGAKDKIPDQARPLLKQIIANLITDLYYDLEQQFTVEYNGKTVHLLDLDLLHALEVTDTMAHIEKAFEDLDAGLKKGDPGIINICRNIIMMSDWLIRDKIEDLASQKLAQSRLAVKNPDEPMTTWVLQDSTGKEIPFTSHCIESGIEMTFPPIFSGNVELHFSSADTDTAQDTAIPGSVNLARTHDMRMLVRRKFRQRLYDMFIHNGFGTVVPGFDTLRLIENGIEVVTIQQELSSQKQSDREVHLFPSAVWAVHPRRQDIAEEIEKILTVKLTHLIGISDSPLFTVTREIDAMVSQYNGDPDGFTDICQAMHNGYIDKLRIVMQDEGVRQQTITETIKGIERDFEHITSHLPKTDHQTKARSMMEQFDVAAGFRVVSAVIERFLVDARLIESDPNLRIVDENGLPVFLRGQFAPTKESRHALAESEADRVFQCLEGMKKPALEQPEISRTLLTDTNSQVADKASAVFLEQAQAERVREINRAREYIERIQAITPDHAPDLASFLADPNPLIKRSAEARQQEFDANRKRRVQTHEFTALQQKRLKDANTLCGKLKDRTHKATSINALTKLENKLDEISSAIQQSIGAIEDETLRKQAQETFDDVTIKVTERLNQLNHYRSAKQLIDEYDKQVKAADSFDTLQKLRDSNASTHGKITSAMSKIDQRSLDAADYKLLVDHMNSVSGDARAKIDQLISVQTAEQKLSDFNDIVNSALSVETIEALGTNLERQKRTVRDAISDISLITLKSKRKELEEQLESICQNARAKTAQLTQLRTVEQQITGIQNTIETAVLRKDDLERLQDTIESDRSRIITAIGAVTIEGLEPVKNALRIRVAAVWQSARPKIDQLTYLYRAEHAVLAIEAQVETAGSQKTVPALMDDLESARTAVTGKISLITLPGLAHERDALQKRLDDACTAAQKMIRTLTDQLTACAKLEQRITAFETKVREADSSTALQSLTDTAEETAIISELDSLSLSDTDTYAQTYKDRLAAARGEADAKLTQLEPLTRAEEAVALLQTEIGNAITQYEQNFQKCPALVDIGPLARADWTALQAMRLITHASLQVAIERAYVNTCHDIEPKFTQLKEQYRTAALTRILLHPQLPEQVDSLDKLLIFIQNENLQPTLEPVTPYITDLTPCNTQAENLEELTRLCALFDNLMFNTARAQEIIRQARQTMNTVSKDTADLDTDPKKELETLLRNLPEDVDCLDSLVTCLIQHPDIMDFTDENDLFSFFDLLELLIQFKQEAFPDHNAQKIIQEALQIADFSKPAVIDPVTYEIFAAENESHILQRDILRNHMKITLVNVQYDENLDAPVLAEVEVPA
ncbi:MAG: hypothetical protein ABII23_09210, partial [bacterium]